MAEGEETRKKPRKKGKYLGGRGEETSGE